MTGAERQVARSLVDERRRESLDARERTLVIREVIHGLIGAGQAHGKRCGYCGRRSGSQVACAVHRDLLTLDPYYGAVA